ncbi:MAG: hypothetical protein ACI8T1_003962 [Verrucomicrobiales bacterium]|jgi:hypothetical protein
MKSLHLTSLAILSSLTTAFGGIDVVFEHLMTNPDGPLPILKAQQTGEDLFDGGSLLDSYGGLERYDGDRLILAIRENGINETAADHDADLAAQFPDRSLIWIDPTTGAPLGVALVVGHSPVELAVDFTGAGGTVLDYYFTFTVDDAGVIYVNYKNNIVRYAPEGDGFSDPTVVFTVENDGSETWSAWRFETLRARGSGADTVLVAGGKTWRPNQGYRELVTTDGLTFTERDVIGFKGGGSSIVTALFGETATQEWIYGSLYPGGSNGVDTSIVRNVRDTAKDEPFGGSSFSVEKDEDIGYQARFISDTEVHPDFPYLVSYSTPSWNSGPDGVNVDPVEPGWIAVHDQFYDPDSEEGGEALLIGLRKIDVTEDKELVGAASLFHGTLGELNLNVLPGMRPGQAELLWHSGIYGYGRYIIDFAPKEVKVMSIERTSAEEASISWTSEVGKFYAIQTSDSLEFGTWATVANSLPGADGGVTSAVFSVGASDAQKFVRVGPGQLFTEDFESGGEGWGTGGTAGETVWALGTPINVGPEAANSGANVYGTNLDSNYGQSANITLLSPVIDLTSVERGSLKLWYFLQSSDNEGGQIRVLDEAADEELGSSEVYTGDSGGWQEISLNLLRFGDTQNSIVGQKVRFEFRFLSDDNIDDDGAGWYIDDLLIE